MVFFGQDFLAMAGDSSPLFGPMKRASEAQQENMITLIDLFGRFSNIAITRMIWTGLPDSVSERFLNMSLYFYGKAAFFEDPNLGLLALPCNTAGEYNMYYEPTRVNVFSFNYNKMLMKDDFVMIRNNPSCTPTAFPVFNCVKRMSDLLRTIDVALIRMKTPYLFLCDEKQRMTYLNALKKLKDNEWFILGTKNFDLKESKIDVLDIRAEYDIPKLWESYKQIENILYTALGIDSADNEKRERLLVDEVNANNMVTEMSLEATLKELKEGCKKVNEMFGTRIDVHLKRMSDYGRGGTDSGDVYNRAEDPS